MNIINFASIDSTNKYLKEHHNEYNDFTFVCADYQTNGRGRENRIWISDEKESLLFSFLVKNEHIINNFNYLSIGIAYVICSFLEELGLNNVSIKWPNDVYVNDKKICGILLESQLPNYLIVGVGLNVLQKSFLGEYRHEPTSIYLENNNEIDFERIKTKLFDKIEIFYKDFDNQIIKMNDYIVSHNYLLHKRVIVNSIKGEVIGITNQNELQIIDEKNNKINISSGEVTLYIENVNE